MPQPRLSPSLPWLLLLLTTALGLVACTTTPPDSQPIEGTEESPEGPTYLIGIIELINPEQAFVMIKTERSLDLPVGHKLSALDATGAWSELEITPEKKELHLTADIKSGTPRVGNLVVYRPQQQEGALAQSSQPSPSPSPTAPPQPPSIGPLQDTFPQQPPPIAPLNPDGTPQQPPPIAPLIIGPNDRIPSTPPAFEPSPPPAE